MNWRAYLEEPALREFAAVVEDGWRILVRRGYESWAIVVASGGARASRAVGGGRMEHPVIDLAGRGEAVVRRYRRGGLMRHLNRERYFMGHRAFDELRATERARVAGVRVPEVIAAAERRSGPSYHAFLATRWLDDVLGMDRWIEGRSTAEVGAALRLTGAQIARMHSAGISHPDLNLRNLLVGPRDQDFLSVHIIDFDRARVSEGPVAPDRRAGDLRRLARSARKLRIPLKLPEWRALREGYGARWPLPPSAAP